MRELLNRAGNIQLSNSTTHPYPPAEAGQALPGGETSNTDTVKHFNTNRQPEFTALKLKNPGTKQCRDFFTFFEPLWPLKASDLNESKH